MGTKWTYFLVTLLFQCVVSTNNADQCVQQNNDEGICSIKVKCPENQVVSSELDLKTFIKKRFETCNQTIGIHILIDLKMKADVFPDLGEAWSKVKHFEMKNAGLETIPDIIEKATNVEYISFANNQIKDLKPFTLLSKLKTLDMSNNIIEEINLKEFMNLINVDFSSNSIKNLKKTDEGNIKCSLKSFDLSKNKIELIPTTYFENCLELEELNMANNYITKLSIHHVRGLHNLKSLSLSNNKFQELGNEFYEFENLEKLLLDYNNIGSISNSLSMPKLKKIDLSFNSINNIVKEAFKYLTELKEINLSNNQLTGIDNILFRSNVLLDKLDVSNNNISIIEPGSFKFNKIKELKLGNNLLQGALTRDIFEGLQVSELDLSDGHITEIGNQCFTLLSSLKTLILARNSISKISESAFENVHSLETLDVSHNQLARLSFAKNHLKNLVKLDVSFNQIKIDNDNIFKNFSLLSELDLSHNVIEVLKQTNFHNLNSLIKFKCSYCKLTAIDQEVFTNMVSLKYLDLSHNTLSASEFIKRVSMSLSELYINNNNLKNINSIENLVKLTMLNCSANNILEIKDDTFVKLTSLKTVDLSSNKNLNISSHFTNLNALDKVYLSKIKQVNFENSFNTTIKELDLSSTNIQDLKMVHITNIKHLERLHLSDNVISHLDESVFLGLELKELYLKGNRIEKIENNTFKNMKKMERLDLSKNNISSLGTSFSDLENLKILNLGNNAISQILEPAFKNDKNLGSLDLHGNNIDHIIINAFEGLHNLNTLILRQNKIQDFGPYHLPSKATNIDIDLDNNLITNMRFLEFSSPPVKSISINGNQIPCEKIKSYNSRGIFKLNYNHCNKSSPRTTNNPSFIAPSTEATGNGIVPKIQPKKPKIQPKTPKIPLVPTVHKRTHFGDETTTQTSDTNLTTKESLLPGSKIIKGTTLKINLETTTAPDKSKANEIYFSLALLVVMVLLQNYFR